MFHAYTKVGANVTKSEIFYNWLKISRFCVRNGRFFQNHKKRETDIKH